MLKIKNIFKVYHYIAGVYRGRRGKAEWLTGPQSGANQAPYPHNTFHHAAGGVVVVIMLI